MIRLVFLLSVAKLYTFVFSRRLEGVHLELSQRQCGEENLSLLSRPLKLRQKRKLSL